MKKQTNAKTVARNWLTTIIAVVGFILALVGYGEAREGWKSILGGEWQLGFFEGVIVSVVIFGLVKKYGSTIDEIVLGLRELGRLRKTQTRKQ